MKTKWLVMDLKQRIVEEFDTEAEAIKFVETPPDEMGNVFWHILKIWSNK